MTVLPEPTPTAPAAGQADEAHQEAARLIEEALNEKAPAATHYRDITPVPTVGTTPPVPQPGRPPMSQRAVDLNTTILTSSVLTAVASGGVTSILWASGYADPTVVALVFGAPTALVLAVGRLVKRAKGVLPEEHHHHYDGPVYQDQRNVHSSTRGVWAKTTNQQ